MGLWFCRFACPPFSGCWQDTPGFNVLVVGPAGAGKTTLLYQLTRSEADPLDLITIPTSGIGVEIMTHYDNRAKETKIILWEIGSVTGVRHLWSEYLNHCKAILFVVDSKACANESGLFETTEVLEEFMTILDLEQKKHLPIYVMANKQDLGNTTLSALEIRKALKLEIVLAGIAWNSGSCSAATGDGLRDAIDWIINNTSSLE